MNDARTLPPALRARRALTATGAWSVVLVGTGHLLLAELGHRLAGPSPEETEAIRVISGVFPMPGVPHSMADFYVGNSLGMGATVLAFGILNLTMVRALRAAGAEVPRSILVLDAIATAVLLGLSIAFFPLPPIVMLAVGTLAFAAAATMPAPST